MKKQKTPVKGKTSALVKVLYVIAAVLMAICVYMVVINVMYISTYTSTYGISVSDMMSDAIQYVITGSISYFIYGVLVFCGGKIIRLLQQNAQCCAESGKQEIMDNIPAGEAEENTHQADDDSEPETLEETQEDKEDGFEQNDIPESEDAVEETEVIEDKSEDK